MSNENVSQSFHTIGLSSESDEIAVDIKNASFEYKRGVIALDHLSLHITKGKIFALLGPNGVGKTTLMRLILGRLQLKCGSVKVFGDVPGSEYSNIPGKGVGYMPQELALFEEFTIEEILKYYGTLYHMSAKELIQRVHDLMQLLNLPETSRPISRLSGGQKRLVSIAITMIHRPKLIILDEPTVGVDSLLRYKIWNYLQECCLQNGQTVLITTHYIEEAKNASNVGFMNYGTILKQSDPQTILNEYNCETLESVFLQLCEQRKGNTKSMPLSDNIHKNNHKNVKQVISERSHQSKEKFTSNKLFDFHRMKALIFRYYILAIRNYLFILVFFLIPIIALSAMNLAMGQHPTHIPIAIYNEDENPEFSKIIIDAIDKHYVDIKMASSNESAFESVVNGTNYMSVVFGKNFSDSFGYRIITNNFEITDEELEESKIKVYADFSNAPMAIYLLKFLMNAFDKFLNLRNDVFGHNVQRFVHILSIEEAVYGQFEFNLPDVFGPGVILAICQGFPIVLSALRMIMDRKNSCLERILVSGVRPIEIFVIHFIYYSILIAIQVLITICFGFGIYQNTQNGSYFDIFLLLFLIGLQGMTMGFFFALLFKREEDIHFVMLLVILPLWMSSGVFWPIETIPINLRYILEFGPLSRPIIALRSILLRGWSITHPIVYGGFLIVLVYTVLISFFNIILFTKLMK